MSKRINSGPFDFGNQTFVLDHETLHFSLDKSSFLRYNLINRSVKY